MTNPFQSPKKRRQLFVVSAMLFVMGGIFVVLFLHTDSAPPPGDTWSWDRYISFSLGGNTLRGTGGKQTATRKLVSYSAIEGDGFIEIKWSPGPAPSAVISTDLNLLSHVKTEVIDGTLKITTDCPISTNGPLTVVLTGPQPSRVELSGSGDFTATGLDGDALDIIASGSSDLTLSGKVHKLTVDISGSGDVDAINLKTKSTDLTISGSGSAKVNATEALDAKILGSGSVTYRGIPAHITQNIAGSGSINPE